MKEKYEVESKSVKNISFVLANVMSLLLRQKQNEVFQSILMCNIYNSVDVVINNISTFLWSRVIESGPGRIWAATGCD